MSEKGPVQLWDEFLAAWPLGRVRQMTLEEYTNANKDDAFIYWIESRLDSLGSIWGGSAFKFGIYCRDKIETKEAASGRVWGEKYAWLSRFGATEHEAFATVRNRLVEVLDAAALSNFARVEEIDLAPMLKWKVAFLYQDRAKPTVFPVFKKEALFFAYSDIDPRARLGTTPYHVMYETLMERHRALGDVFEVARGLWEAYEKGRTRELRAWAVPVAWTVQDASAIEALVNSRLVEAEDVDPLLDSLLAGADVAEGDRLAFLVEGDVRALGTLTRAEPGSFEWEQIPVNFPSGLLVNPTSEVRELTAAERQEIWSHLPTAEPSKANAGPRYWKIAPGKNAVAWPEWKERGIVAIGWPELGDLTKLTKAEFDKRAAKCAKDHDYGKGASQAWTFRNIRPGDRVVANQGKHRVLGIGTVASGYLYRPGTHTVEGEDFPHQLQVTWNDVTPRAVEQYGWQRTVVELSKSEFEALLVQPGLGEAKPPNELPLLPCDSHNIILYGPPGTGKTYSTVRRALELILGNEKLVGLGDKGLMALFREHQARGQIEFVTFHQAYGYEEFVEGLRPVLDQSADAQVRYEIHDGVFKRIALRAAAVGLISRPTTRTFDDLWEDLVGRIRNEDVKLEKSVSGGTYQLSITGQGNIQTLQCEVDEEGTILSVTDKRQVASRALSKILWDRQAEFGSSPEQLTYAKAKEILQGGNHFSALWIAYRLLKGLSRTVPDATVSESERKRIVQEALDKPGPSTTFSFSVKSPQFVLIVDEINRGNVSKILGELITLLEPDKRLAGRNELKLPLSYSPQHRFAVPPNLHVLGTMNTADRSIALMDVALRRRFTFEELMPDVEVIRSVLAKRIPEKALVDLVADVFEVLNGRIRFLYDRDHQLGHSYFLDVSDVQSLRRVFTDRVIPMLQEYFYGAWDKICVVLGCPYNEAGEPRRSEAHLLDPKSAVKAYAFPIVKARTFPEIRTLGFDHDDHEDRVDYNVSGEFRRGSNTDEDLYRTFLGTLALDKSAFEKRFIDLAKHAAERAEAVG